MPDQPQIPLLTQASLEAFWHQEYEDFRESPAAAVLKETIGKWAGKGFLKETSDSSGLVGTFFAGMWGYRANGTVDQGQAFTCYPEYPVPGAGQTGGMGSADLALGHFQADGTGIPQVLCEFKDVRSGLDHPQSRKGNTRSPVKQCFDYLRLAGEPLYGNEPVRPVWCIVTDMNEFRLYHRRFGPTQCQIFHITGNMGTALCGEGEDAAFQRFVFRRMLAADMLLAEFGKPPLEQLLDEQWIRERDVEKEFYAEYRAFRESLFRRIVAANPDWSGTRGKLVRLTQRLLDRLLFVLFCEDMGTALDFPPNLLRELLSNYSKDPHYDPDDNVLWERIKALFEAMNLGKRFVGHPINRFNGGLFRDEPDLNSLRIPAAVFCARGQGSGGEATIRAHRDTLLYFSASYNFGAKSHAGGKVIDFYALGRIFEQSITELEIMEAEADGRVSVNRLSKRKTDGVYYTPEWVTGYLVRETVGARLEDLRQESGLAACAMPGPEDIEQYRAFLRDRRRTARVAGEYLAALERYRSALDRITILDPACGSGAFLVQSLDFLLRERRWLAEERERIGGQAYLWDQEEVMRTILSNNIFGTDINPESVEITKLALWLHTALPGKALCDLDAHIRCGNSLVGPDFDAFYRNRHQDFFARMDEEERERVNAFDWRAAFPAVFARGGFDCVVGNPPYIKLQHFRQAQADVAAYLAEANRADGTPCFRSTRTGNFDMYLPFIERGVELLNPAGRMGYIAPSLWAVNEYGQGLRGLLRASQALDRWIDFKSFQVFEEAITYTALQFYRRQPGDAIRCAFAPDGDISGIDWASPQATVAYADLPEHEPWYFMPDRERSLFARLMTSGTPLGDPRWTRQIFQGLITSADHIYHLQRLAPDQYRTRAGEEVVIEDALMRPLVSGTEAKRYLTPQTDTFLLFPYDLSGPSPQLFPESTMASRFPCGWAYLRSHEAELRKREGGKFDDDQWYRFGRNQNLDKQETPKLGVAETVPSLRVFYDSEGEFFFNNVRVNGIIPASQDNALYLLGVLDSPILDFLFRRIAKPKDNGFFEANKQFIAPLPIPAATDEQKAEVGRRARELQDLHSQRRDLRARLAKRLDSAQCEGDARSEDWLWAEVKENHKAWLSEAPAGLGRREATAWAKARREELLAARYAPIDARLRPGMALSAECSDGELRLLGDGVPLVAGVFVPESEADFLAAQWRHLADIASVTERATARRLLAPFLDLRKTANATLRGQVVDLDRQILACAASIGQREREINALLYRLFGITDPADIRVIERG